MSTSTASSTSSSDGLLLGRMADPAVEAPHEEHRGRHPGAGQHGGVVAGSRGELDDREAACLQLGTEGAERACGHRDGLEPEVGSQLELGDQAVEPLAVRGAGVDREPHPARDHVDRAGLDVDLPDGGDGSVDRPPRCHARAGRTRRRRPARRRGRASERCPRGRPRPSNVRSPRTMPTIPIASPSGTPARSRTGPCSMCTSRKHSGSAPRCDEGRAPDAAALLVPEDCDGSLPDALDRLDRRDDSERAVELAAERHGVEVRARPDARLGRCGRSGFRRVDLDLEPGLPHPAGGQLVRAILAGGTGDAVGADARRRSRRARSRRSCTRTARSSLPDVTPRSHDRVSDTVT